MWCSEAGDSQTLVQWMPMDHWGQQGYWTMDMLAFTTGGGEGSNAEN